MLLRQKSTESISCLLREHTYYQGTVLNTICHWWDKDARSQVHRPMADPAPLEDCMSYNSLGLRSSFLLHSMSIAPPSCSNLDCETRLGNLPCIQGVLGRISPRAQPQFPSACYILFVPQSSQFLKAELCPVTQRFLYPQPNCNCLYLLKQLLMMNKYTHNYVKIEAS